MEKSSGKFRFGGYQNDSGNWREDHWKLRQGFRKGVTKVDAEMPVGEEVETVEVGRAGCGGQFGAVRAAPLPPLGQCFLRAPPLECPPQKSELHELGLCLLCPSGKGAQ